MHCAELCFRAILYNIILNIKHSNTDAEIENLTNHIYSNNEKLTNLTNHINSNMDKLKKVSADLNQFSEKLIAIEENMSDLNSNKEKLKTVSADLKQFSEKLVSIEEDLSDLKEANKNFVSSGSSHIRASVLVISFGFLLKYCSSEKL